MCGGCLSRKRHETQRAAGLSPRGHAHRECLHNLLMFDGAQSTLSALQPVCGGKQYKQRERKCSIEILIIITWFICGLLGTWFICGLLGYVIGMNKEAGKTGLWLGLLFGPLGLLAAAPVDRRAPCPSCGTRLNGRPSLCPGCRTKFEWDGDACTYFPPD